MDLGAYKFALRDFNQRLVSKHITLFSKALDCIILPLTLIIITLNKFKKN